mmetsp:Transcript_4314/g.15101  ORF Transcript_4314/g.15101 Transcript_4314/m.15101 type:complete len:127 (+) Transcript_4314:718-1098(+)
MRKCTSNAVDSRLRRCLLVEIACVTEVTSTKVNATPADLPIAVRNASSASEVHWYSSISGKCNVPSTKYPDVGSCGVLSVISGESFGEGCKGEEISGGAGAFGEWSAHKMHKHADIAGCIASSEVR